MKVAAWLETVPPEQKEALTRLAARFDEAFPSATIVSPNGFPVWCDGERWLVGLGSRKAFPMVYVMAKGVLDRYEARLGTTRTGVSCVAYKGRRGLPIEELDGVIGEMVEGLRE